MPNKKQQKLLSLKEQLQNDIAEYNRQIITLDTNMKQMIGAKLQAQKTLKCIEKLEKENKEK